MKGGVWLVSRELDGVAGAGGLKDAVRGIADALTSRGINVTVVLPGYGFLAGFAEKQILAFDLPFPGGPRKVTIGEIRRDGMRILLVEEPTVAAKKSVYTYTADDVPPDARIGEGHRDVHLINLIHQRGALEAAFRLGAAPGMVHGHDGHCGFIPALMRTVPRYRGFFRRTGVLVTIHNAGRGYQQEIPNIAEAVDLSGLDETILRHGMIEGRVNPLLLAGRYGRLSTVSPGYARELIRGEAREAESLGSSLRERGIPLPGITNGLNPRPWTSGDPAERRGGSGSLRLRRDVVAYTGSREGAGDFPDRTGPVPDPALPWVFFHGRLTPQKGAFVFAEAVRLLRDDPECPPFGAVVLAQGVEEITEKLRDAAGTGLLTFFRGYHTDLARRLFLSSSFVAVPSLWEPCGTTDMIGQATGALPVAHAVGGLTKIRDGRTGFLYRRPDAGSLAETLKKALLADIRHPRRMRRMRRRAEKEIYGRRSWRKVLVRRYLPLYRRCRGPWV